MIFPAITALAAVAIIFIQVALMALTIRSRYRYGQGLGDGGHPELLARIRSHANLTENAPIILFALALVEMGGGSQSLVAGLAGLLVLGRLLHPLGLFRTHSASLPRFLGVLFTTFAAISSAIALLFIAIGRIPS